MVNVLGKVTKVGAVTTIKGDKQKIVTIADISGRQVDLSLAGDAAGKFLWNGVVLSATGLRLSESKELSFESGSKIEVNPDKPECKTLLAANLKLKENITQMEEPALVKKIKN